MVFSRLAPRDLMMLLRVNKRLSWEVSGYMRVAFSIDRILQPFFSSPATFRALQAKTGILISGSAAVQFFDRNFYPGSDLDLYLESRNVDDAIAYLKEEGYVYVPPQGKHRTTPLHAMLLKIKRNSARTLLDDNWRYGHVTTGGLGWWGNQSNYGSISIGGVLNFHKGDMIVQLVVSKLGSSPMAVMFDFHSSVYSGNMRLWETSESPYLAATMNFISHEKAYSLFPNATFGARHAAVMKDWRDSPGREVGRRKYITRGWRMLRAHEDVSKFPEFVEGSRWVGDHATWTIPLYPALPELPPDSCASNGFYFRHTRFARSMMFALCHSSDRFQEKYGFSIKNCLVLPLREDDNASSRQDLEIVTQALKYVGNVVREEKVDPAQL